MSQYPAIIELADLDGSNGFKLNGPVKKAFASVVSSAGDVNGDGYGDLMVGARGIDRATGAAYIVYGTDAGFDPVLELSALDGTNGFRIYGESKEDRVGCSVSSAGDMNGDGIDDMIVGGYGRSTHGIFSGAAYVVFGTTEGFDPTLELTSLDGTNGFRIIGEAAGDKAGYSVSAAGDVNGDGFDDVVLGADRSSQAGEDAGAAYVVFGKASGFDATFELRGGIDGNNGFKIYGIDEDDNLGQSVSSAGDMNGDGYHDVLVNAFGTLKTYVVFGKAAGFDKVIDLTALDGANGFAIDSSTIPDYTNSDVCANAGDINADGYADIVLGAADATANAGAAFVVFGKAAGFPATLELADLDGSNGFRIDGEASGDFAGWSVSGAGDVNGDGFADVIIGAFGVDDNRSGTGAAYVVFGKAGGFDAAMPLSSLDGNNGFQLNGKGHNDFTGTSVSSAGDVNGDGFADLMVSASRGKPNGALSGLSYVVFGSMPGEAVTRTGTDIGNAIHGGDLDDRLSGLGGADALLGHGGMDILRGGDGEDTLTGGAGADRARGGGAADLFVCENAADSTGLQHDAIMGANFIADRFDLPSAVWAIDARIVAGTLNAATFDADLSAAADAAHLGANHAAVFTPDGGDHAGRTFLIVDANGIAGYQASEDFVFALTQTQHLAKLGIEDFI